MNPDICRKCDAMNRSCCTLRVENNDGLPAPISENEIQRIYDYYGGTPDILDNQTNSQQFIDQMALLFPRMTELIPKLFPLGHTHWELKTIDNQCVFKKDGGCALPEGIRPHFCRIYPFWFFDGEPHIFHDPNCLALEKSPTIPEVLLSLGTTPEKLRHNYLMLCEDWKIFFPIPNEKIWAFL